MPNHAEMFRYWGPLFISPEMLSACGAALFIYLFDRFISAGLRYDWRRSNTTAHVDGRQTRTCLRVRVLIMHTHTPCSVGAYGEARRGPSKDADCWQRVRTDRCAAERSRNFPPGWLVRTQECVCGHFFIHVVSPSVTQTSLQFVAPLSHVLTCIQAKLGAAYVPGSAPTNTSRCSASSVPLHELRVKRSSLARSFKRQEEVTTSAAAACSCNGPFWQPAVPPPS